MKKKLILLLLFLFVSLIATGLVYGYNTLNQINKIVAEPELDEKELNINYDLDIDTVNLAVFGIDGRSDIDGDRADTIMIVSMDFRNGTIKVTSVMRDLLVLIPETDDTYETLDKINASYAYGGAETTVKTLNENFDLNISDYIIVNFDAMVDTVDAVGGVEVDVKNDDVLDWTNKYIDDVNDKVGRGDPYLEDIGPQTITGVQALAYARNRYSDSDFYRTKRQREVVGQIAQKAFEIDIPTGINLLSKVYPYVKTTLSIKEITTYAKAFLGSTDKSFLDFRVPTDRFVTTAMINSISYVVPNDLSDNVIALHAFIYGPTQAEETPDESTTAATETTTTETRIPSTISESSTYTPYVPSDRVYEISNRISYYANSSPSTAPSNDDSSSYEESEDNSYTEPIEDTYSQSDDESTTDDSTTDDSTTDDSTTDDSSTDDSTTDDSSTDDSSTDDSSTDDTTNTNE